MAGIIIGIAAIMYFMGILIYTGLGSKFSFIWLIMGIIILAVGILAKLGRLRPLELPGWTKLLLVVMLLLGLSLFGLVEGLIISGFHDRSEENLEYIVVLGAQMKEKGPSRVLKMRLEKAYEYLSVNENTIVVLSGGKGGNEPISEAEGMYRYLAERGIEESRMIQENQSQNTHQNLVKSKALIEKDIMEKGGKTSFQEVRIGIVSSNFHIVRAAGLARKAGYTRVYGIPAPTDPYLQLNNMVREFFGIVKDKLAGNL